MGLRKERLVWVLHASTFFFFLGIAVVNPLVSPVSIQLGATPFVVGVVAAIASVFSLTFKPIGGLLGDRGMRLGIMMTGALAGAIAAVLYITSDLTGSIIIFAVGRAFHGFGMAMFFPASLSTAIDLAPRGRVGETLGWRGMMFSMGNLIGPAMGGFIADSFGLVPTFLTVAVFSILSFFLVLLVRSGEKVEGVHGKVEGSGGSYRELIRYTFIVACLALFLMAFSYGGLYAYLPALYKSLGMKVSKFGLYASIIGGSGLFTRVLGGKGADRIGAAPVASIGLFMVLIAYVLVGLKPMPPASYVSAAILGAGFGLTTPSLQMMALADLPRNVRTFGSGIYTMFFDLGNITGPVALGYVAQVKGYEAVLPYLKWPVLVGFAALLIGMIVRKGR